MKNMLYLFQNIYDQNNKDNIKEFYMKKGFID